MDDRADADGNAGHGREQPPPDDRERRRGSGAEPGDQPVDGAGTCQCAGSGPGSDRDGNVDSDGDSDGGERDDGERDDGGEHDDGVEHDDGDEEGAGDGTVDSDPDPASTERYLGWLKLWRVVLLVILALVRLIRAL